jgi:hypothetical protein
MNQSAEGPDQSKDAEAIAKEPKKGIDWADPSVPVGNAPKLPLWPLILLGAAWVIWIVFLCVMAAARVTLPVA